MVAVRVSNLKPGAVILQGIEAREVDPVAVKIAQLEHIPLVVTKLSSDDLLSCLTKR